MKGREGAFVVIKNTGRTPGREAAAAPRQGVSLHLLGDQGVLFDFPAQRLYAANTTASFIWCCLEERRPLREICGRLADTFGLRLADAVTYVEGILAEWRKLGLIDGGPDRGG